MKMTTLFIHHWLWLVLLGAASVEAGQIDLKINLTVNQPTCDLTVGEGAEGNKVDFASLAATGVSKNPLTNYQKQFQLKIANCTMGGGIAGLTPKLKISGSTVSDSQQKLFNNNSSAKVGFIVLINSQSAVSWDTANAAGDEVSLAVTGVAAPNQVPIQVGISNGNDTGTVEPGNVSAAATFTFRYG